MNKSQLAAYIDWIENKCEADTINLAKQRREQLVFEVAGRNSRSYLRFPLTGRQEALLLSESLLRQHIKSHYPKFPCHLLERKTALNNHGAYIEAAHPGIPLSLAPPETDLRPAFAHILDLLVRLARIPPIPAIGNLPIHDAADWPACFGKELDKLVHATAHVFPAEIRLRLPEFIHRRIALMPLPRLLCIVHNDLDPGNLLVNITGSQASLSGIIDFERFIFGDPLKELSRFVWLMRRDGNFGSWLWQEYKKRFDVNDDSLISLELYWLYDMLNQIRHADDLCKEAIWKGYLAENKQVIESMVRGDELIW